MAWFSSYGFIAVSYTHLDVYKRQALQAVARTHRPVGIQRGVFVEEEKVAGDERKGQGLRLAEQVTEKMCIRDRDYLV